jgi:uncharacterized protein YajQ (UPF0234 family)
MPSFDVVSEVDRHELTNAVDQTNRDVANRFDFKGTSARVTETEGVLQLQADNEFQLGQLRDVLYTKIAKRGVDVAALAPADIHVNVSQARQDVKVRQGIDADIARKLVKLIKESKLKVQAAIQGDQVRISGKKRDDLQQVMGLLKDAQLELPLQFTNFRD